MCRIQTARQGNSGHQTPGACSVRRSNVWCFETVSSGMVFAASRGYSGVLNAPHSGLSSGLARPTFNSALRGLSPNSQTQDTVVQMTQKAQSNRESPKPHWDIEYARSGHRNLTQDLAGRQWGKGDDESAGGDIRSLQIPCLMRSANHMLKRLVRSCCLCVRTPHSNSESVL